MKRLEASDPPPPPATAFNGSAVALYGESAFGSRREVSEHRNADKWGAKCASAH